jgi:hypothetical protein
VFDGFGCFGPSGHCEAESEPAGQEDHSRYTVYFVCHVQPLH